MQHNKTWDATKPCYGKFWVDTADGRKRKTVRLGVCRTRTMARQLLREYIDREGINSKRTFIANTAPATTFRAQAERWIASLPNRRRKPVKPATVSGWQDALNAWILQNIGDKSLAEVSNGMVRELVEKMAAAGLSPKTIVNYVQVVKLVIASAVNSEGEPIHPRTWNNDFIGLPIVNKASQHRPTITSAEVERIVSTSFHPKYALLFALLAGTGLRIGEALGLKVSDVSSDCRILRIQRSVWRGKEQSPKTPSAVRQVDVPEALAKVLRSYVSDKEGYLFATMQGRPLLSRNVLRVLHKAWRGGGFHVFRRFRLTWLRRNSVPKDLERYWMGHAAGEVGDLYSKLNNDLALRQQWADKIGLGFELVHNGPQNVETVDAEKVA